MSKSTRRRTKARLLLAIALAIAVPLALLAFVWLMTLPDVSALEHTNPSSTALMKARVAKARAQGQSFKPHWTWVPLTRISPHLQRAVVAAEDASFFTHEGFDWEGIKDAALRNLETGEMQRGGSTITQQLAKNLYLSPERSLFRKAREALIARSLEHRLSKKRILELYLNVAEWGRGVYGAEAAAYHHFGKPAKELTADEAALLAAILPSPRLYDPIHRTSHLVQRQQRILHWMNRAGGTYRHGTSDF